MKIKKWKAKQKTKKIQWLKEIIKKLKKAQNIKT